MSEHVPLLSVRDLHVTYSAAGTPVPAVRGVNMELDVGETLGLAGESGCGKSSLAGALLRLLPPAAKVTGEVLLDGEDVLGIDVRPANGKLYGLTSTGRILVIDPASGGTQLVSTSTAVPSGSAFGVDFNPVVDRLRVVSSTGQNLRINVDTGAATVDTALSFASGDANSGTPSVRASTGSSFGCR